MIIQNITRNNKYFKNHKNAIGYFRLLKKYNSFMENIILRFCNSTSLTLQTFGNFSLEGNCNNRVNLHEDLMEFWSKFRMKYEMKY